MCVYRLGASAASTEASESGGVFFFNWCIICTAAVVKWLWLKSVYKRLYGDFSWGVRLGCGGGGPFENHRRISIDKNWYSKRAPARRLAFRMLRQREASQTPVRPYLLETTQFRTQPESAKVVRVRGFIHWFQNFGYEENTTRREHSCVCDSSTPSIFCTSCFQGDLYLWPC